MKIEIKNRFTNEIILCGEYESIRECLEKNRGANLFGADLTEANLYGANLYRANLTEANLTVANLSVANLYRADLTVANLYRADLTEANLSVANLTEANLSGANLSVANLTEANLYGANLTGANLTGANLYRADLTEANLPKRYITIGWIGSRRGYTVYNFDDDVIQCGCFTGTLKDFDKKVKETHKNNKQYLKEYLGAINYIKSLKETK